MVFYIACDLGCSPRWEVTCLTRASGYAAFLRSKLRNKELGQPLASSDVCFITSASPDPLADLRTQHCTPSATEPISMWTPLEGGWLRQA